MVDADLLYGRTAVSALFYAHNNPRMIPPTFRRFPTSSTIESFLSTQSTLAFTYAPVGATSTTPPPGYTVDHNRIQLGAGQRTFDTAQSALRSWKHFDLDWVKAIPSKPEIEPGVAVAVLGRGLGLWCLMACRIVYTVHEEENDVTRFGFAYGTLPAHAETGEERFMIEWNHRDDTVSYDILAFSKPHGLFPRLANSWLRRLQRRFAADSKSAMVRAAL